MSPVAEIAVVTGAAQGLGEAVARRLAAAGIQGAALDLHRPGAEAVAADLGPGHLGLAVDVRSTASVAAAAAAVAAALGTPSILVNCAGVNRIGPAETFSDEDWDLVLDVNLTGTWRCCRAFGARMLEAGRGSIVNIASVSGAVVGLPGRAPYHASKAGVVGLTRQLGVEWASRGVRVNAVLPGPVRTPMIDEAIAQGIVVEQEVADRTPAGRFARPDEVAGAVLLLCSADAGFITAQTLVVDGGYSVYGAAGPASRLPGPQVG